MPSSSPGCDPCVFAGYERTCGTNCGFECDDGSGGTAICYYQLVWAVYYCSQGADCHTVEIWEPLGCSGDLC